MGTVAKFLHVGMYTALELSSSSCLTLQKHAENAFPRMLMEIVDPALLTIEEAYKENVQGGRNRMEDINQVMLPITKLGLSCSKQAPSERICIRDAAAEMHRIRDHHAKK